MKVKFYILCQQALICLLLGVLVISSANAETYYISKTGKDTNKGTSPGAAWASISKINATQFQPGDSVLFEGGSTFDGSIYIRSGEKGVVSNIQGTPQKPIVFSSFGTDRAIISSGKKEGFKAYNAAGFKIENLIFSGAGRTVNETCGVEFYMDVADTLLEYVYVENVEVFGYREAGIAIASWDQTTGGYKDVWIKNSISRDNGDAGIVTYAQGIICHKNVYVGHNKVYNNSGLPNKWWNHSGSGIMLGGVDGGVIEYCEAYNNGWLNNYGNAGPIGIWGYHCNNLLIQYNESHHNKTNNRTDGGGFDIDGGCTGCVIQYNYSHDNDGAGYVISQYRNAPPMSDVIVRYNISENDARKNSFGSILVWTHGSSGAISGLDIYNNTIYLTPSSKGSPSAVWIDVNAGNKVNIRNNLFVTTEGVKMIYLKRSDNTRFEGNNYWTSGGDFNIAWNDKNYTSPAEWRTQTGQEMMGSKQVGLAADPELKDPGAGVTIGDPFKLFTLSGYELQETSALIGSGLDLSKEFGLDVGKTDFFGNRLEGMDEFTIGAYQFVRNSSVPVVLSSFEVSQQGDAALLEWETTLERNSSGFEVEVSLDENAFLPLGFVGSKAPNSDQLQQYNFLDQEPNKSGTRYYRLKQLDLTGNAVYSEVRSLTFETDLTKELQAFPNPFTDAFEMHLWVEKEDMLTLTLTDPLGRVVLKTLKPVKAGKNSLQLALPPQHPTGLYLLTAELNNQTHRLKMLRMQ